MIRRCPKCNSLAVRRSHRRGLHEQIILRILLQRPFRCQDCEQRHYGFVLARSAHAGPSRRSFAEALK